MKVLITVFVSLISINAFAGGGPSINDDAVVYIFIITSLIALLGLVHLFDFLKKIRKDKDYREHLRTRIINLISTVKAIFVKEKKEENGTLELIVAS